MDGNLTLRKYNNIVYIIICEEFIRFYVSNSNEDPNRQKKRGRGGGVENPTTLVIEEDLCS